MSNIIRIEDSTVTAEFLRVFKKADSITVNIDKASLSAKVSLIKKIEDKDFGQTVDVRIEAHSFAANISSYRDDEYSKGNFHTFGLQHDGNFQALLAILKPGDRLEFDAFDSRNGYMEHAQIPKESWRDDSKAHHPDYYGLHGDTLRASIHRKTKAIVRGMTLISGVTPKNTCRSLS